MNNKRIIMKNGFYLLITLLILSSCESKKKNVVFILVDDLGWTDLGYTGSTFYETPNIDMLSEVSIQFDNAYAAGSVCSPSRAAIMTGKHPARVNITDWIPGDDPKKRQLLGPADLNELPSQEVTIAEVLKDNGYSTFFSGKWHLGSDGFFPEDQGFETNIGGHHRGSPPGGYYSPYKNPKLSDGPEGEYLTDRLTNESIEFIDKSTKDKPFFLFMSYYTVHTPIQPNKKYVEKFNRKLDKLGIKERLSRRVEGSGFTTIDQYNPEYASMVYALDENIGKLIAKLKEKGLYENTTIIFTSDNGGLSTLVSGYKRHSPTSVLPLRGGKGWLYEGGIRVPLLIKPANYNGDKKVISEPVVGQDFYSTILSETEIEQPSSITIDGYDLSPLFVENKSLGRKEIIWHYPHYHASAWTPGAAIRQGDWKLIEFYETNKLELYNLADDISEKNDLSSKYPEKTLELKKRLSEIQKSLDANRVEINSNFAND